MERSSHIDEDDVFPLDTAAVHGGDVAAAVERPAADHPVGDPAGAEVELGPARRRRGEHAAVPAPGPDPGSMFSDAEAGPARFAVADDAVRFAGRPGPRRRGLPRFVVVVAVAVAVVVAFWVGRLSAGGRQPPVAGVGPRVVSGGAPVGFAHSRAGAGAAATSWVAVLGTPAISDAAAYDRLLETLAAPDVRAVFAQTAQRGHTALARRVEELDGSGRQVVFRSYPLATQFEAYSATAATVRVWAVTMFAIDGKVAVVPKWALYTWQLSWVGDDWRASAMSSDTAAADPTVPLDPNQPSALAQLLGFTPLFGPNQGA